MAVLPKKYSKRGPMSVEDYILYMIERIEFYASATEKRILELEKENVELKKKNEKANLELAELKDELLVLKELLEG